MPSVLLTDRRVASLKATGARVEYFDRALPGFGLRVSPAGAKSWVLLYRVSARGKLRRLTLGTYPELSLADARARARAELRKAHAGRDPGAERQQAERQTVAALADLYLEKYAKRRKRSWVEDARRIRTVLLPAWGDWPVSSLRRAHVRELVEGIAERGAPIEANRTLALVRKMLNYAIGIEWIEANPAAKLERPAPERARDRVLSEDEIRALWRAWDALPKPMGAFFKLRLLTAQRGGEVQDMRWADLDLAGGWWTIPAERSKNKLPHRVPLVGMAKRLIEDLRADVDRALVAKRKAGQEAREPIYVLEGARGTRQQAAAAATFPVQDFRGHDLRRTAASLMAAGGIDRLTIAKLLNHVERGVTAVYDRHSYDPEKQAALVWWDDRVRRMLDPQAGTVRPFRRRRA